MNYLNYIDLKHIRPDDLEFVGEKIVNLAKLINIGISVPAGFVVLPPVLTKGITKEDISKLPLPSELKQLGKNGVDYKSVWNQLLAIWIEEFTSFSDRRAKLKLSAQPVFFSDVFRDFGTAYLDPYTQTIQIEISGGKISENLKKELEEIVKKADKKLIFPNIYHWVIDKGIKIVKVSPQTPTEPKAEKIKESIGLKDNAGIKKTKKSYTKCFFDASAGFVLDPNADGIIIKSSSMKAKPEEKIWKVLEICSTHPTKPVIFTIDKDNLLDDAEIFLFLRNKKQLLNLQLGLCEVSSAEELATVKRELASRQLTRKGSLKFYLSVGELENLVNFEEYLEVGIDGVIVDLDKLSLCLGNGNSEIDKLAVSIRKLLEIYITKLNRLSIPQIYSGSILYSDELIRFLVEKKAFGMVVNTSEQHGMREYLLAVEQFHFNRDVN